MPREVSNTDESSCAIHPGMSETVSLYTVRLPWPWLISQETSSWSGLQKLNLCVFYERYQLATRDWFGNTLICNQRLYCGKTFFPGLGITIAHNPKQSSGHPIAKPVMTSCSKICGVQGLCQRGVHTQQQLGKRRQTILGMDHRYLNFDISVTLGCDCSDVRTKFRDDNSN